MKPYVLCHFISICKVSIPSFPNYGVPVRLQLIGICVEFGYGVQAENSVFATSITIFLGGAGYFVRSLVNLGRIRQP